MLSILKSPPPFFEQVVAKHFAHLQNGVLEVVTGWSQDEQKVRKSEPVSHVLELRMSQDAQVVITAYAQHWLDRRRRVRSRSYSGRSLLENGTAPASRLVPAAAPSAAPAAAPAAALASRGPASARPDLAAVHIATDGCGLHSVTISPNDATAPRAATAAEPAEPANQ